ncbi:chorismate synthase [Candidatus Peregrinibacteria bacterium]|nr:chorismate synthase [Candidatus Peregrinibacteria bacterium]
MPGNAIGQVFRVSTWGESHGMALGVLIDGCPPGITLNEEDLVQELKKRKPQGKSGTKRKEPDIPSIMSGVFEGKTTGTPISVIVLNKKMNPDDYTHLRDVYRPGHADYTYEKKYGIRDHRGGGRSSGRETVARVIAGAIAKKVLSLHNIRILGHTTGIGHITAETFNKDEIGNNPLRCADKKAAKHMLDHIQTIKEEKDSVGGTITLVVKNTPPGLGEPVFNKLDADLAHAVMSIGSVKGVSFGAGFKASTMKGSQNNDSFDSKNGHIYTTSNNAGGVLGGISNGEDIIMHVAIKPPASIGKEQKTVTRSGNPTTLTIEGRHDVCIVPRVISVIESMAAIVLTDHLLRQKINHLV